MDRYLTILIVMLILIPTASSARECPPECPCITKTQAEEIYSEYLKCAGGMTCGTEGSEKKYCFRGIDKVLDCPQESVCLERDDGNSVICGLVGGSFGLCFVKEPEGTIRMPQEPEPAQTVPTTSFPLPTQPEPTIVIANSIDKVAIGPLIFRLDRTGPVLQKPASKLSDYKDYNKNIVILGGHNAPEGVGDIVSDLLTESEKRSLLASPKASKKFVKEDVWVTGQTVTIYAGYERAQTWSAWASEIDGVRVPIEPADMACDADADCIAVSTVCGDCGADVINRLHKEKYESIYTDHCIDYPIACDWDWRPTNKIKCVDSLCTFVPRQ